MKLSFVYILEIVLMFIEILINIILFKGDLLIYAKHCIYISIKIFAIKSLSTKRIFIYHLMSLSTGSLHPQWPSPFPETQSNKNLASLRYNGSRLQLLLVTLSFIAILKRMSGIRFYFFSLPLQYRYFFLYIPSRIMQGRKP